MDYGLNIAALPKVVGVVHPDHAINMVQKSGGFPIKLNINIVLLMSSPGERMCYTRPEHPHRSPGTSPVFIVSAVPLRGETLPIERCHTAATSECRRECLAHEPRMTGFEAPGVPGKTPHPRKAERYPGAGDRRGSRGNRPGIQSQRSREIDMPGLWALQCEPYPAG